VTKVSFDIVSNEWNGPYTHVRKRDSKITMIATILILIQ